MANSLSSGQFKEYATVDTMPTGLGYFTNALDVRKMWREKGINRMFFSIWEEEEDSSEASDTSDITVVLQFKTESNPGWQDFVPLDGSVLTTGNRVILEDVGVGVLWRAGVKWNDYTNGSISFGFDW